MILGKSGFPGTAGGRRGGSAADERRRRGEGTRRVAWLGGVGSRRGTRNGSRRGAERSRRLREIKGKAVPR